MVVSVCALLVGLFVVSCRRDPDPVFMDKLAQLSRLKDDSDVVSSIADIVRYAHEHEIEYGYVMHIRDSGELVRPSELEHHLDDDIVVTIQVGPRAPYNELQWNPPANWYITRLVMH